VCAAFQRRPKARAAGGLMHDGRKPSDPVSQPQNAHMNQVGMVYQYNPVLVHDYIFKI
jgi:hypothetical protein